MISIYDRKKLQADDIKIWDLLKSGIMGLEIAFEKNPIQHEESSIINAVTRNIQFKCDMFNLSLTIQNNLSLRIVKKIKLWKTEFSNTWIKFLLNEALYTHESKVFEIPRNIEQINLILFRIESQLTTFKYMNSLLCLVLDNNRCIGDGTKED
jgi:hypothetical protein